MRPGPKKPGESAAEYSARIKAMEQKFMGGGRPKTSSGSSSGGGRGHMGPGSGLAPKPGESKTDYQGRVRDMKAAGVKPTTSGRMGNDISPRRVTGGMGMKSGGMVKGKKK